MLDRVQAPWWQWALFSVGVTLVETAWIAAAGISLLLQGVDLLDYVLLPRPPWIEDGWVAARFALLLTGQTLAPLLLVPLFRPARVLVGAALKPPADWAGVARRVGVGVLVLLGVQVLWEWVGSAPAEHWRLVEHLTYATVGGGRFWPLVWLFLAAGLVIPVTEEILFRGIMFGWLRRRWSFWPSAVVGALLFGLPHGVVHALPTAVMALYLAYQAERDRSLVGAMVLHCINNLGALVVVALSI